MKVTQMADQAKDAAAATPAATAPAPAKPKLTREGMTAYRTFDSPDEANAYLAKCGEDFSDFADQPFALKGVNPETGEFDPAIYTDEMRVRVAVLKNRAETAGQPSTIKAIVVGPVPSLPAILGLNLDDADAGGLDWLQKIVDKELNHVLVRPLREAENLETAIEQMPTTRLAFITSTRDAGGIIDAYNDHYKTIGDAFAKKFKVWEKARRMLTKSELRKAMESKAFALEYFPALEDRGADGDGKARLSLFVMALQFGAALAKSKGDDPAIFDKWLATRDAQTLAASTDDEDEDDISLDDLTADFITEAEATPVAEAVTEATGEALDTTAPATT